MAGIRRSGGSFAQRFQNIQKNEESSFLPGSSGSVKELTLAKRFPSSERFTAVTVVRRDGGLAARDLAAIEGVRASLAAAPPVTGSRAVLLRVSPDRTTALLIVNLNPRGEETLLKSSVGQVEQRVAPLRSRGLSGPAGFSRDAVNVFSSINGTLLLATAGLVFVLLIIIYRSPIFWFIPLFSVLMAEAFSRFCGWAIAEAGVTVNGQSAGVLPVLVFGAGTDYALLLVARYREELRRHESPVHAMRQALRRAGPAVVASGSTVIVALLCLSLAEVNGTSGLGPIGAMGVALAMLAMRRRRRARSSSRGGSRQGASGEPGGPPPPDRRGPVSALEIRKPDGGGQRVHSASTRSRTTANRAPRPYIQHCGNLEGFRPRSRASVNARETRTLPW